MGKIGLRPNKKTRLKMSKSHTGTKKPWAGKCKRTKKTRLKMSKSHLGIKHTEKAKEKIRQAKLGIKFSKEVRIRMSEGQKGTKKPWAGKYVRTKETKLRMRKAHLREKCNFWKGGISKNKERASWVRNRRNRVVKRLKVKGLSHTFEEWQELKKQYNYTCPCCKEKEPFENQRRKFLTEDHIIPLSKKGTDEIRNIQPLCSKCNSIKNTKTIKYAVFK